MSKWQKKKLGEVACVRSGIGFPVSCQGGTSGKYPFAKVSDISAVASQGGITISAAQHYIDEEVAQRLRAKPFPAGTIVFAKIGEAIRKNYRVATTVEMIFDNNVGGISADAGIIDPDFLRAFLGTVDFYTLASATTVPAIRKSDLEEILIPIPGLSEQRQIVARIKEMMDRVREIELLTSEVPQELTELKRRLVLGKNRRNRPLVHLAELVEWVQDSESVKPHHDYMYAGIRSFGKGLFLRGNVNSDEFAYKTVRRLRHGDFIFPKLMAWEGAFAMVTDEFDGTVVSPEFVVFRPKSSRICSEVLDTYFRSPACLEDVNKASTGSNRRRRRLNPKAFLTLSMPVPSNDEQQKLKAVYRLEADAKEAWQNRGEKIKAIRNSILRKVFAGEL